MSSYNSNEYSTYRINRAKETLNEVLIENKLWNTSINRMYYACFYAVSALLVKNGIEASTHKGVRQQFGQAFVKKGMVSRELAKHYTDMFEKRSKGDYNDFFDYEEDTVVSLFPLTVTFVTTIEGLLKNRES